MFELKILLHGLAFAVVHISWAVFAIALLVRLLKDSSVTERKRATSSWLGLLLQFVAFAIAISPHRDLFLFVPAPLDIAASLLAMVLSVASLWLLFASLKRLGQEWSVVARTVEGHKLITDGPYGMVRHPIYAATMALLVSVILANTHWMAFLPALAVFVIGTRIRTQDEEKLLRETFGQEYEDYASRVPALIPRFPGGR